MPITPHAIWNFVEQSDFCWVMLFYTTDNKTMTEFNQHERLKITFRKLQLLSTPSDFSQNRPKSRYRTLKFIEVFGLISRFGRWRGIRTKKSIIVCKNYLDEPHKVRFCSISSAIFQGKMYGRYNKLGLSGEPSNFF